MIMNDKETYSPHFDIDLARGKVGEKTVEDFLYGTKHEVKKDEKVAQTGNLYVEEHQYKDAVFRSDIRPSGINITDADSWHWAGEDGGIWLTVSGLKKLLGTKSYPIGYQSISNGDTNASEGRLVPLEDVLHALGFVKYRRGESPENQVLEEGNNG